MQAGLKVRMNDGGSAVPESRAEVQMARASEREGRRLWEARLHEYARDSKRAIRERQTWAPRADRVWEATAGELTPLLSMQDELSKICYARQDGMGWEARGRAGPRAVGRDAMPTGWPGGGPPRPLVPGHNSTAMTRRSDARDDVGMRRRRRWPGRVQGRLVFRIPAPETRARPASAANPPCFWFSRWKLKKDSGGHDLVRLLTSCCSSRRRRVPPT